MYLIGAGGHAKVICDILKLQGMKISGVIEDDPNKKALWDIPVIGTSSAYDKSWQPAIISIGNNKIRKKVADGLSVRFERAIHPSSITAKNCRIDYGTVLMAGTVINPDTTIGRHVIINTGATVDHDCQIGDFVHIAPGATLCGGITVGEGTLIGAGATILPNIKIGKWVTIGGGATVTTDVPSFTTVVGCPARPVGSTVEANG